MFSLLFIECSKREWNIFIVKRLFLLLFSFSPLQNFLIFSFARFRAFGALTSYIEAIKSKRRRRLRWLRWLLLQIIQYTICNGRKKCDTSSAVVEMCTFESGCWGGKQIIGDDLRHIFCHISANSSFAWINKYRPAEPLAVRWRKKKELNFLLWLSQSSSTYSQGDVNVQ